MKLVAKRARRDNGERLTDGGHTALNFINTCKKDGKGGYIDHLGNYSGFLKWCSDLELIDLDIFMVLDLEQYCYSKEAEGIYCSVVAARDCFDELFNSLACGENVHPLILDRFNMHAERINAHLSYHTGECGLMLYWKDIHEEMNLPYWLVISAARSLVDSGGWRKIKKCPACSNLFMDKSRSHNKLWCNHSTCGSLLKNKKYYEKKSLIKNELQLA